MNKKALIPIVVILAIIIGIAISMFIGRKESPETQVSSPAVSETAQKEDSTEAINQALEEIDIGDLDAEFEEIDSDLQSL